jgi:hypothetical protein
MQGNLDVDAGDDTWTLAMGDREIASGGRYDRLSFTVSKGELGGLVSENVLDLLATPHSAPYPLAAFEGLVSVAQLKTMTSAPALLEVESAFFERVFGANKVGISGSSSSSTVSSFNESLSAHPLESAGLLLASAVVGMVAMFGVLRLFSPHFSSSPSSKELSYTSVLDESAAQSPRVEIELEKPSKKVPREHLLL